MRFLFLLAVFLNTLNVFAQNCRVFALTQAGEKGILLRTEIYREEQLLTLNSFDDKGNLAFTLKHEYTDSGQLSGRVQTFKGEHEFDLIRRYTYDDTGRKTGELFGNNRTGKWGSYRYSYNANDDLDTIFIYQKNGDLTHLRVFDIEYDEEKRKIRETVSFVELEIEEVRVEKIFTYAYNQAARSMLTMTLDAEGNFISSEEIQKNPDRRILKSILKYGEDELVIRNYYDSQGRLARTEDRAQDKLVLTTRYGYDARGKLLSKTFIHAKGKKNGEIYEWY